MSTCTSLSVADYPLIVSNDIIPEVMTIFRETDRLAVNRQKTWRKTLIGSELYEEEVIEGKIIYSCETRKVIDRLNVMGFTLQQVQNEFELGYQKLTEFHTSYLEEDENVLLSDTSRLNFVKSLTFDVYFAAFKEIILHKHLPCPTPWSSEYFQRQEFEPIIKYILGDNENILFDDEKFLFGFPIRDIRFLIRLACELAPSKSYVIQDVTSLINDEYYEEDEKICFNASRELIKGYSKNSSRIILTEGKADAKILKESLELLYPHLSEYYSFFDFNALKSPGGAGNLVNLVKAFATAGVENHVVALFDNDTAARDAVRSLKNLQLPSNIVFRHYPQLELLNDYPTIGPNGLTNMNINGLAASIELYLGVDILRNDQGDLTPVQWKGYIESLKSYQGEILHKSSLQSDFYKKRKRCLTETYLLQQTDWSGIIAILEDIFRAFH